MAGLLFACFSEESLLIVLLQKSLNYLKPRVELKLVSFCLFYRLKIFFL